MTTPHFVFGFIFKAAGGEVTFEEQIDGNWVTVDDEIGDDGFIEVTSPKKKRKRRSKKPDTKKEGGRGRGKGQGPDKGKKGGRGRGKGQATK